MEGGSTPLTNFAIASSKFTLLKLILIELLLAESTENATDSKLDLAGVTTSLLRLLLVPIDSGSLALLVGCGERGKMLARDEKGEEARTTGTRTYRSLVLRRGPYCR
jgi:hypothetical protein